MSSHSNPSRWPIFAEDEPISSTELGPLRDYRLVGQNSMRRIRFSMTVFAGSAGVAIKTADTWRSDNNKVRAEQWRCKPGF